MDTQNLPKTLVREPSGGVWVYLPSETFRQFVASVVDWYLAGLVPVTDTALDKDLQRIVEELVVDETAARRGMLAALAREANHGR